MIDSFNEKGEKIGGASTGIYPMNGIDFGQCKAILFDFGGTLDSDGEHWLDRFYDLYESAGINLPQERIKEVFYQADAMCCHDPQVDQMGLRSLMRHHVRFQFSALNLVDKVKEELMIEEFCVKTEQCLARNSRLLSRLHSYYQLAVVSNFYGNVATICEEAGVSRYLTAIFDSTLLGFGKPDLKIFRMALQNLNAAADECVFVGDSYERDMLPAREIGMKTIWMKGPNPRFPAEPKPVDYTISSLAELEALLL